MATNTPTTLSSEIRHDCVPNFGCPHPYLAVESLSGPKEVWFFNGFSSSEHQQKVIDDYAANTALMERLQRNSAGKASLTFDLRGTVAIHRADRPDSTPWILGQGRFLVMGDSPSESGDGSVFEAEDGTRYVFTSTESRAQADLVAAAIPPKVVAAGINTTGSLGSVNLVIR